MPIISPHLMGGIGNQLFQIAFAYAMSKKFNMQLLFEKLDIHDCVQGSHPSKYYSSLFEKLEFVEKLEITEYAREQAWEHNLFTENQIQALVNDRNCVIKTSGFFQSEKYFKEYSEEIKALFTPSIGVIQYLEKHTDIFTKYPELKECHDYCLIGIRRGDYIVRSEFHNPCGKTYYNEAIRRMNKECYYIVSDDMNWVKKNYSGPQYRYLEIDDDLIKLLTLTLFKNYIISNSSYYWWGSYLSIHKDIRIIAPDKWINFPVISSIYRDEMEIIERPVEID